MVSIVCSVLLMGPMQHSGLALALTLSSIFNAIALLWLLNRRIGGVNLYGMLGFIGRLLPGLLAMAAVVAGVLGCADWQIKGVFWQRFAVLGGAVGGGAAAYAVCCWLCRVTEVKQLWDLLLTRLRRRASGGADAG
jgi:putative peptidoglycan lipid II flippase